MWGLCHSVEIIHQHHHHFYQIEVPLTNRNRSHYSKRTNPNTTLPLPTHSSHASKVEQRHEDFTSRFYHSKRNCLGGSQRGIEVLTARQNSSFQLQKISLQKHQSTCVERQQQIFNQPLDIRLPQLPRGSHQHPPTWKRSSGKKGKQQIDMNLTQSIDPSILTSRPTCSILPSRKDKQAYFNRHQLRQSKMGFQGSSISHILKNSPNASVSSPLCQQSQLILMKQADSLMSERQEAMLMSEFKTEKMFDQAKSIVSLQSLSESYLRTEESVIVAKSIDAFQLVSSPKDCFCCQLYLARDKAINCLVTIRRFQFKYQKTALTEAQLYSHLSNNLLTQTTQSSILQLYRIMMEGTGLEKSIYFLLEPYEMFLQCLISSKKGYFRAVPSSFSYFLNDFGQQITTLLTLISQNGIVLSCPLALKDFVVIHGRFKLHSLCKFSLDPLNSGIQKCILAETQRLKASLVEAVNMN